MPIGSPKPQTMASKKYQEKAGWVSKSYKLKRETVEAYTEACQRAGVSAAGQLTKMMMAFASENDMDEDTNAGELLVKMTEQNKTREILEIMNECEDLEEAKVKIKALLNE